MTASTTTTTTTATTTARKSLLRPGWKYPEAKPASSQGTPSAQDDVDYRSQNGPRLTYLWCQDDGEQKLTGQSLYLGAEVGCDGKLYLIPGHAPKVMVVDPTTDHVSLIGPQMPGKFKWLRGVRCGDVIYGIPCNSDAVLRIHVPTGTVSQLPIPYEEFYQKQQQQQQPSILLSQQQRAQNWKYHGGTISPIDGCLYAIPQSALHVLKIDPTTEICTLIGPALPGRYKWYGGIVGQQDQAIYGIPHNSAHVLRILPPEQITLHGDFGNGGHKWHGAAAAANGDIVSVPANADTVLCIRPAEPEPILTQLNSAEGIRTGRHRVDNKYKYLGAITGSDGHVYCFPSGSEHVLQVNAETQIARSIGPNIFEEQMERICQNKWQNGLTLPEQQTVFAIPLAAESVLQIDCATTKVTTWPLPMPNKGLAKWEGGVVAPNGVVYCVPNNHKAVLRIEAAGTTMSSSSRPSTRNNAAVKASSNSNNNKKATTSRRQKPSDEEMEALVYKSGIPTLRSSAHRVKFAPKNRKHDPKPKNRMGEETGTTWLPDEVCQEEVFDYDAAAYDLTGTLIRLLQGCDPNVVGTFRDPENPRLEDFVVPTPSTWRSVNGGSCESAQKTLSQSVFENEEFLAVFDRLVHEVALPYLKRRLVAAGAVTDEEGSTTFYYQRPPTLRLQPGPAWAQVKAHDDAQYGHQNGELNFWLPLTDRTLNNVDLHCETRAGLEDYHPIPAMPGQIISFHGSSCKHYANPNGTPCTRVSMDFRIGVEGFFDPYWQMRGTTDDHGRKEARL